MGTSYNIWGGGGQAYDGQMTIWQIAAGSDQRDYVNDFLDRGLAFVGGQKQIALLEKVRPGDLLVLKRGLTKVEAIGEVFSHGETHGGRGDKHWLRDFDGWDLEAYVYVKWKRPTIEVPPEGLTRGTISRIHQEHLQQAVVDAFKSGLAIESSVSEPGPTTKVGDEHILSSLISHGMAARSAEDLTQAFARIRRLARYYRQECDWRDVREHETRTFLVVPLLQALGWAEQQIKIELAVPGGRVDLACFHRPYRRNAAGHANGADCELIIETKGFAQGLNLAPDQAKGYAKFYPSTRAVVVTNGYCYKVYAKVDGSISSVPSSYLNLLDPRNRYPIDPERTAGCLEVLIDLLPT